MVSGSALGTGVGWRDEDDERDEAAETDLSERRRWASAELSWEEDT